MLGQSENCNDENKKGQIIQQRIEQDHQTWTDKATAICLNVTMLNFIFREEPRKGCIEDCSHGHERDKKQAANDKLTPHAKGVSCITTTNSNMLAKRYPAVP